MDKNHQKIHMKKDHHSLAVRISKWNSGNDPVNTGTNTPWMFPIDFWDQFKKKRSTAGRFHVSPPMEGPFLYIAKRFVGPGLFPHHSGWESVLRAYCTW